MVIVAIVTISVYNVVADYRPTKRARVPPAPMHCAKCTKAVMGKPPWFDAACPAAKALFGERPPADQDAIVGRTCFAWGVKAADLPDQVRLYDVHQGPCSEALRLQR